MSIASPWGSIEFPIKSILPLVILFFSLLPGGILLDLLYKELAHKEEYFFYYNLSVTKVELWAVALLLPYLIYLLVKTIGSLWIVA